MKRSNSAIILFTAILTLFLMTSSALEARADAAGLFMDQNGRVGIGTAHPTQQLHLFNSSYSTIALSSPASTAKDIWFGVQETESSPCFLRWGIRSDGDYLRFQSRNDAGAFYKDVLHMHRQGNISIGTTDPGAYTLYVNGPAYSTGGWAGSDKRWKKKITPLKDSLDKVTRLHAIDYEWKIEEYPDEGFTEGKQIGLIAQEVEQVIPELVRTNDNGFKSVSYEKLTALLVEAIKELKSENAALKQKNDEIEARLVTLEKDKK